MAFKLGNLHNLATGKRFPKVSKIDRIVWRYFGSDPLRVALVAEVIREGLEVADNVIGALEADEEFAEGRILTVQHLRRERSSRLRQQPLDLRRQTASLRCELCDCAPRSNIDEFSDAMLEAHHRIPIALGVRETKVADLALLCANCHRIVHRAMRAYRQWLSLDDLKLMLKVGKR